MESWVSYHYSIRCARKEEKDGELARFAVMGVEIGSCGNRLRNGVLDGMITVSNNDDDACESCASSLVRMQE